MTALEKLMIHIGLIDEASGPAKKVCKNVTQMQNTFSSGMKQIATGGAAVVGAGYGMAKMIQPAREMSKALGEVKSLNVAQKELTKLERAGDRFAMSFGENATEFVKSAYDIQSSIGGLKDGELASFTTASNILAKGTKADAATVTGYVSTMYGVFEKQATAMGKGKWIEQMAGKTATAVQIFRTTGAEMQAAFAQLGAAGASRQISMEEQMSVLGMLQQVTGSGARAATQYRAFLTGAAKAQKELGLSFVDSNNNMLPMASILDKIRSKYGDTIDTAEGAQLKKAFGTDEAVAAITTMINKTGALKGNIKSLENVKGMGPAIKMAKAMTDPVDQLGSSVSVVWRIISAGVSKILLPLFKGMNWILGGIYDFLQANPILAQVISFVVMSILSLIFVLGVLKITLGFIAMVKGVYMAFSIFATTMKLATAAQWLYNTSLYGCPLVWLIVAIIAVVAAVAFAVYQVIKYWDDIVWAWEECWDAICSAWDATWNWLKGIGSKIWEALGWVFDKVKAAFLGVWEFGKSIIQAYIRFILGKIGGLLERLTKLPIIGSKIKVGLEALKDFAGMKKDNEAPKVGALEKGRKVDVAPGGLSQSISSNNSTNYGDVYIQSTNAPGPAELQEWAALQA